MRRPKKKRLVPGAAAFAVQILPAASSRPSPTRPASRPLIAEQRAARQLEIRRLRAEIEQIKSKTEILERLQQRAKRGDGVARVACGIKIAKPCAVKF